MISSARDRLEVAICQLTSVDDLSRNLQQITALLGQLDAEPPGLVCLPENALFLRVGDDSALPELERLSEALDSLLRWAIAMKSYLHVGSVPVRLEGRLYSSSVLLTPHGEIEKNYQKIHLFDVDVEGEGAQRESATYAHGEGPAVFSVQGWKFGSSICYDVRFSELYSRYAQLEVDAILIPSAFLVATGRAHWHLLTRARAIESQAYVLAAAQGGTHLGVNGGTRLTYGHSLVVDPWGVVVAECVENQEPGILRVTLSREKISATRKQIPMRNHRRLT